MEQAKWLNLMARLEFDSNLETYTALKAHYEQKHRHYHNVMHINSTLALLEQVKHLVNDYDGVEIALWFHDAIYKTLSSKNELDSANWTMDFLKKNKANPDFIEKVCRLIMVTQHNSIPDDNDEKLIVDIDLSILGCSHDLYEQFEKWVRKEYRLIPDCIYKKKRKQILTDFLAREKIYSHEYFFEKYEQKARLNLRHVIGNL